MLGLHISMIHTRPEILAGTLQPLWSGFAVKALCLINQGGTLDDDDIQFVSG